MTDGTLLDLTKTIYDGFLRGDMEPLFANLHPEVVWTNHGPTNSPFHGTFRGHDGVKAYFGNMAHVELEKFDIHTLLAEGDTVVALIDAQRLVKATGKRDTGSLVHVVRYDGGKLVSFELFDSGDASVWE